MRKFLMKALPFLMAGLIYSAGFYSGSTSKDTEWKEVVNNEYVTKVKATTDRQAEVRSVSQRYQDELQALEGSTDRVIADLRNDNRRLYAKVCAPGSARGTDGRCESVISVELHESTVKSLVRITESADLKEKALQDTIRKLQNKQKER